jgi:hypothetical protein
MVEGQSLCRFNQNVPKHGIDVVEKLASRNAERFNTRRSKPPVSSSITPRLAPAGVGLSVDFDCQSCIAAEKIEHVRTGRMLTPKFQA